MNALLRRGPVAVSTLLVAALAAASPAAAAAQPTAAKPTAAKPSGHAPARTLVPHALPKPTNGELAYVSGGNLVLAKPDGSNPTTLATGVTGPAAWLPDGSRALYIANGNVWSVKASGQNAAEMTNTGEALSVAVDGTGIGAAFIGTAVGHGYESGTMVHQMQAAALPLEAGDGFSFGDEEHVAFIPTDLQNVEDTLWVLEGQGQPYIYQEPATSTEYPLIAGDEPNVSPDGSLITFVKPDAAGVEQVFTAPLTEDYNQIPPATAGNATQVTFGASDAAQPHLSPDGTEIAYAAGGAVQIITTAGAPVRSIPGAGDPSWQPVLTNTVARVAGHNAIGTGIAASQVNWATLGAAGDTRRQAGAVVLSRSDTYADALAGSAFADAVRGPLLITPPTALDAGVLAEIKRILPGGGTVYLLGGTGALSQNIENQLTAAGYAIQRFAGSNRYDTAVKVDEKLQTIEGFGGQPYNVVIATGTQYYDALAAGADAGSIGATVVVLTDGTTMPAASAAYLNTLDPRTNVTGGNPAVNVFTVGGPGTTAFKNALADHQLWPDFSSGVTVQYTPFVGANAEETAIDLAAYFDEFQTDSGPRTVALATMRGWYDGLTGGAMVGAQGGFLLLTQPTALYPGDATYLDRRSGSIQTAELLGGTAALPAAMEQAVGAQIGLPDSIQYPNG